MSKNYEQKHTKDYFTKKCVVRSLSLFSLYIISFFPSFLQWGQIDQVFKTVSKNYLFRKDDLLTIVEIASLA